MSDAYIPGTEETDPKKQNMAIQQVAARIDDSEADIAANTAAIAANTAAIAGLSVNKGYFAVNRNGVAGSGIAATNNKILFTTEQKDSEGWFDNATNYRYTPLVAGQYFFGLNVQAAGNSGGSAETCQAVIYKNGSPALNGLFLGVSAAIYSSAAGLLTMNGSTDYVEGFIYLPTGVTTYLGDANRLNMYGWRVGA